MHQTQNERRTTATLLVFLGIGLSAMPMLALDPMQPVSQLNHTAWTARDGLEGSVTAITQTPDGYLWVGSTDGLFRFDGVTFERYKPEIGTLLTNSVSALLALSDGGLWVGYLNGGASFLRDGKVTNYSAYSGRGDFPVSTVRGFVQDLDGAIWAAVVGGFGRLDGDHWERIGRKWDYPAKAPTALFVDDHGTLWVADSGVILFLPRGEKHFHNTGLQAGFRVHGFAQLADGSVCILDVSHHLVRALNSPASHNVRPVLQPPKSSGPMAVDHDGALWVAGQPVGLLRIPSPPKAPILQVGKTGPDVEIFTDKLGLSDIQSETVYEDREGNIWVGTDGGLDRFRYRNLTWRALRTGTRSFSLVDAGEEGIWAATRSWFIQRVRDGSPLADGPKDVRMAIRAADGTLWFSAADGLWKWSKHHFSKIAPPERVKQAAILTRQLDPLIVSAVTTDHAGSTWVSISGFGEFQLKDGAWKFTEVIKNHPDWSARAAFADNQDRVWLVYGDLVAKIDRGQVQSFSETEGLSVGLPNTISGLNSDVWVGGENGIAFFRGTRFHKLTASDGSTFGLITGIVAIPNDGLWLAAGPGIVHIPEREIQDVFRQPSHKVAYELFDVMSDLPEHLQRAAVYSPGVIRTSDGSLWFATRGGVARINPSGLFRNRLPPPVSIRSLTADDKSYSIRHSISLPPLTKTLHIVYTALSLSIPERVRFRYKLEGHDEVWQEAGARRSAFYTNLSPANYRFRVIACNNDGVWNELGASLDFTIAAAWYQTYSFKALCCVFVLGALYCGIRIRMRTYAESVRIRFDDRLSERTRIARDLHDTLLQTIQGSKLVVDHAQSDPDDPVRTRRAIERLSLWLERAMAEGRAALESLRSPATHSDDLAAELLRAAEAYLPESMKIEFSVGGNARPMHPVVCGEVIRIGEEAIRNACKHSGAKTLNVALRQDKNLILEVSDNGCGFDPRLSNGSRPGHFGIIGMRERSKGIGGRFYLGTTNEGGTCLKLIVPGKLAFKSSQTADSRVVKGTGIAL